MGEPPEPVGRSPRFWVGRGGQAQVLCRRLWEGPVDSVPLGVFIRHFAEPSNWENRLPLVEAKTSGVYGRQAGSGNWVLPSASRGAPHPPASGGQSVLHCPERDTPGTQTSARPKGDRAGYCEAGGLRTLQKSPSLEAQAPPMAAPWRCCRGNGSVPCWAAAGGPSWSFRSLVLVTGYLSFSFMICSYPSLDQWGLPSVVWRPPCLFSELRCPMTQMLTTAGSPGVDSVRPGGGLS